MKRYNVTVNGKTYDVTVEETGSAPVAIPLASKAAPVAAAPVAAAPVADVSGAKVKVTSPMPGTVLSMNVKSGDAVKKGQVLCVLEAMKMENEITSPDDGTVSFAIAKGATVKTGDLLVAIA